MVMRMEQITFQVYRKQYKLIEKRFVDLSDYVWIHPQNYPTFSNQFINMFLSVCSEIDSLTNELCKETAPNEKKLFGINNKMNLLIAVYPKLRSWRCKTKYPYEEINFVPFAKFDETEAADWWKAYNLVKHARTEKDESGLYNYQKANLKNIMYALSALFIILSKAHAEIGSESEFNIESEIFEIEFLN